MRSDAGRPVMILDDPLPRMPDNPFDTPAWLDYLADAGNLSRAIDQLLEEQSSLVARELIDYAVTAHVRLSRAAAQAREHLAQKDIGQVSWAFWRGALAIADPEPPKFPRLPGDAF